MKTKSLTYTSRAVADLSERNVSDIYQSARHLNALDGITGLLLFDGARFLQIIEGADVAIDDLMARLRRDARHHDIIVRDEREVEERSFPDWSMRLVNVSNGFIAARSELGEVFPPGVAGPIRSLLMDVADHIAVEG